jgi:quercetin dioxygenase-like cupin family protein
MFACIGLRVNFGPLARVAAMQPVLVPPGAGEVITDRPGRHLEILCALPGICVTRMDYAGGEEGADLHVHREHTDSFYALEGTITVPLGPGGAEVVQASAGTLVSAPPNLVHGFRNEGPETMSVINVHAPDGGFAHMLRRARDGQSGAPWDSYDPPENGGRPVTDGLVSGPGEGEPLAAGATTLLFKAQAADGDGALTLIEMTVAPGFPGPPLHRHADFTDCFYVLEGTLDLHLGEDTHQARAGTFAAIPPGTPHTFGNPGSEPVRVLGLMAPGGFEAYIKELWASGELPDPGVAAEITARHDIELV